MAITKIKSEIKENPQDHEQRTLAATELDQNIVVLAGAGTGKTTLLIERLSRLILRKGIRVERLVSLTFTKKAAEEMRVRLEEKLRAVISANENEEHVERAKKALEDIPKAQIGTIHSFAGHILKLYPIQAGLDPQFREDDGTLTETLFETVWEQWITQELSKKSKRASFWRSLLQHVTLSELKDLASSLTSPLIDLDSLQEKVDLKKHATQWADELNRLVSLSPSSERAQKFNAAVSEAQDIFSALARNEEVPAGMAGPVPEPPKSWDVEEARKRVKALISLARRVARVDEALLNLTLEALNPFVSQLKSEVRRQGLVSFDGLLVYARNLLRDHPAVRNDLKRQFDTFLIDEFQDTDPLQGEILFYLAEKLGKEENNWKNVDLEPGRLFLVGDPKQSIYRFRGADIAAFEAFQNRVLELRGKKATLTSNFRSRPHLIQSINSIFPMSMKEVPCLQPAYSALTAARKDEGTGGLYIIRTTTDGEMPGADDVRSSEAQWIANWIQKNKVRYGDCAILLRSTNPFSIYLDALKRLGIPYLAEGEKYFYRTPEVVEFLNLISSIANPDDQLSLAGVLRSPLGGLTDKELWQLKTQQGLDYRKKPALFGKKISRLYKQLHHFHLAGQEKPVRALIEDVFNQTWFLELVSQGSHGEQAVANLLKIQQLAEKWAEEEPLTLEAFVKRFQRYSKDEKEEGENPLADANYDAVKVMTIHKAKGLEFPVVFLPNLCAEVKGNVFEKPAVERDWRRSHVGLRLKGSGKINGAMLLIDEDVKKREEAEEVRVFYVAATRARDTMFMFIRDTYRGKPPYAGYLDKANFTDIEIPIIKNVYDPEALKKFSISNFQFSSKENLFDPKEVGKRLLEREKEYESLKGGRLALSPSYVMSQEPEKRVVVDEEMSEVRDRAVQIGLVCHKVMEEWDFSLKDQFKTALHEKLEKAAYIFEMNPRTPTQNEILKECAALLEKFFKSSDYKELTTVKILGREIPFLYPHEGKVMRGVIDILYEKDGEIIIGDYKTNKKLDEKKYKVQGEIYAKAIWKTLGKKTKFKICHLSR